MKPIRFVICLFLCPAVAEITNSYFVPPPTCCCFWSLTWYWPLVGALLCPRGLLWLMQHICGSPFIWEARPRAKACLSFGAAVGRHNSVSFSEPSIASPTILRYMYSIFSCSKHHMCVRAWVCVCVGVCPFVTVRFVCGICGWNSACNFAWISCYSWYSISLLMIWYIGHDMKCSYIYSCRVK